MENRLSLGFQTSLPRYAIFKKLMKLKSVHYLWVVEHQGEHEKETEQMRHQSVLERDQQERGEMKKESEE